MDKKINVFLLTSSLIIAISIVFFAYKKYDYEKLNNKMYVLDSQRNINMLYDINNHKIQNIEFLSAFTVAHDIINAGQKDQLDYDINFAYLCKYWDENLTLMQYVRNGLSKKVEENQTIDIYEMNKQKIEKGIDTLNTICKKR